VGQKYSIGRIGFGQQYIIGPASISMCFLKLRHSSDVGLWPADFFYLWPIYSLQLDDHFVYKLSSTSQLAWPTQPSIPKGR